MANLSQQFVNQVSEAVAVGASCEIQGRSVPSGLAETVDLACDIFHDSRIRHYAEQNGSGVTLADHFVVKFADDSHLSVLAAWCEDNIAFLAETDNCQPPRWVGNNPWGDAGARLFDNISQLAQRNAAPGRCPELPGYPMPQAVSLLGLPADLMSCVNDDIIAGCQRCNGYEHPYFTFTLLHGRWLCRPCVAELGDNRLEYSQR